MRYCLCSGPAGDKMLVEKNYTASRSPVRDKMLVEIEIIPRPAVSSGTECDCHSIGLKIYLSSYSTSNFFKKSMYSETISFFTTFRPYGTVGRGVISISTNILSLTGLWLMGNPPFYQYFVPSGTSGGTDFSLRRLKPTVNKVLSLRDIPSHLYTSKHRLFR